MLVFIGDGPVGGDRKNTYSRRPCLLLRMRRHQTPAASMHIGAAGFETEIEETMPIGTVKMYDNEKGKLNA
jgi:hypothetical protein